MAVKNWHFGKIVILWVCFLFPSLAFWFLGTDGFQDSLSRQAVDPILAAILLALGFLIPVTWKWLSGKEKRD